MKIVLLIFVIILGMGNISAEEDRIINGGSAASLIPTDPPDNNTKVTHTTTKENTTTQDDVCIGVVKIMTSPPGTWVIIGAYLSSILVIGVAGIGERPQAKHILIMSLIWVASLMLVLAIIDLTKC